MSKPPFTEDDVHVWRVRRRAARWAVRAALGCVVVPVLLTMVAVPLRRVVPFGEHLLTGALMSWAGGWIASLFAGLAALILAARRRVDARSIEASRELLRLVGPRATWSFPRSAMEGALVVDGDEVAEVEVALKEGDVLCVRAGPAERARELVAALGFGAAERRVAIPLGGPQEALSAGCGAVLFGVMALVFASCGAVAVASEVPSITDWIGYAVGLVFVATTLGMYRGMAPGRLVIGADGVLHEGSLRTRFFPRRKIFGAERIGQRLALLIRDGDEVKEVTLTNEHGARQEAFLQRIRAALELAAASADPRAATLARGAESAAAWRERVRKMVVPGKGYRGDAIPSDTLLCTAADVEAPADVRVGAAMAIGMGEDEAAKQELRKAIEGIANEKLRVAIEGAANGEADEEALAAALAEEARAMRA